MGHGPMTELYVCVHVAEFSAQALVRLRPDLARSPVVVFEGEAPLEKVSSVNARAMRLGVRHAMTRTELDSFTGVTLLKRSAAEERNAQAALLDAVCLFTPRVEVQPTRGAAWVVVLDMTGSSRIFGTAEQIAARIAETLRALQFSVRVAASSNLHAAVSMAASALHGPVLIPHGEEARHLARLPLAVLDLTTQQAEAFALWGLNTLGDLAALPEVDLVVRLGQQGRRLQLLARGEHPHLLRPQEEAFALEEFLELDTPVEALESLLFLLAPMLDQLITRAQTHALSLASLTMRLGLDRGLTHERTIKTAVPVLDRSLLLKLLHLDLEAHPPAAAVLTIHTSAEAGVCSKVQLGLWSPQLPEPARLDVTLARIAALVGEDRVGSAVLPDTHRPGGFQMQRFFVPASAGKHESRTGTSVALRRFRPPVVIKVRHEAGRLSAFHLTGTPYRVEQACGPWRRSGDWWSDQVWSTEEWDVQATSADSTLLCVLSHDLLDQQWKIEALYD